MCNYLLIVLLFNGIFLEQQDIEKYQKAYSRQNHLRKLECTLLVEFTDYGKEYYANTDWVLFTKCNARIFIIKDEQSLKTEIYCDNEKIHTVIEVEGDVFINDEKWESDAYIFNREKDNKLDFKAWSSFLFSQMFFSVPPNISQYLYIIPIVEEFNTYLVGMRRDPNIHEEDPCFEDDLPPGGNWQKIVFSSEDCVISKKYLCPNLLDNEDAVNYGQFANFEWLNYKDAGDILLPEVFRVIDPLTEECLYEVKIDNNSPLLVNQPLGTKINRPNNIKKEFRHESPHKNKIFFYNIIDNLSSLFWK